MLANKKKKLGLLSPQMHYALLNFAHV